MLGAILGAVESAAGVFTGNPALVVAGVSGVVAPSGISDKDKARVAAANSALQNALNGDASALQYMIGQSNNSATQVGKNAFKQALQQYYNAQQQKAGGTTSPTQIQYQPPPSSTPSPIQSVVDNTVQAVRNDIAGGVQQIGAGTTTYAANSISGTGSAFTLPTNSRTLLIMAGVAVGALLILKKH